MPIGSILLRKVLLGSSQPLLELRGGGLSQCNQLLLVVRGDISASKLNSERCAHNQTSSAQI